MSIEDNIVEDSASHAANLHANWSGSIARNKFIHDTGRLGYLKSNTGVRGGNGGQGVRWIDNDVDGYYRELQMNDVLDAVISGNGVNRSGDASIVYGAKNSGSAGNAVITGNTFRDAGRLRGRPKPEADAGEEDDVNLINESGHIVLSGGENVSISGNSYENDHRRIALGKLTVTLGATSGVLVDAVPQGNNLTGLSNDYPGDMLYTLGNTNSPSFFARIATGGISARDFMSNTDGTGVVLATTAYLDTPLSRMQESYVKATITSIVQGTTTTVNVSGSPDIKTGDHVVFLGGDMTEIIEMTAEATKINANQFTVPINSTTFTPYTTGGEVIRGAAAVKQTISFDAPSMAALTDEAFRIRVLEMDYIQTGVAKWAPTGTGTMKWVPTRDPTYFIPGPTGATIDTDPASTTVEGFGSPSFIQTIKAPLDDLSHVLLLTDEGGGIHRTIGRITSVTDDDTIVLTANALRDYTGAYVYTIENKVRFGCGIIGDQDTVENRARRVQINWLDGEVGGSLASWHIFPDTLSFTDMAKEKFLTSALTLGTGENIEYTAGVIHLKRQRLDDVRIKFGGPVTGDAANYVKCRIRRLRQESGVAVWRTIGAATTPMDVELTQSARLAGDTINITAPRHVNGSMNANDLFDSREADLLVVELYAVGTGSDVPPLEILVPELPW